MQWTGGWPSLWILSLRHPELRAGMQTGTKPKQTNFIASGIKAGWEAATSLQSQPLRAAGIPWSWVPPRQRLGKLSPASANKFRLGWASLALSKRMLCKDSSPPGPFTGSLDLEFLEMQEKTFWHGKELSNTTVWLGVLQEFSSQSHLSSCDSTTATSCRKKLQIFKELSLVPQALR